MAITAISVQAYNHRARLWKCTGDGSATTATIPNDGTYTRAFTDTAVSTATKTPTAFDYLSSGGGLLVPSAGTAQAVSSTVVNNDGSLAITFSAAPTNAAVVWGVTVFDKESPDI